MRLTNVITAVDVHACGEPGRVIIGGVLDVPGKTMFEKKIYLETHCDGLRKRMLREPRGYPGLCCNVVLPPTRSEAKAGFVIMEQSEYPPMSGSNTICTATVLLETGMIPMQEPITEFILEAPGGLIEIHAEVEKGKVRSVAFQNVPAFAVHLDAKIEVPKIGTVTVDVGYGGMFCVITDAKALGLRLAPDECPDIVRLGEMIKAATREQLPVVHPENGAIAGVTLTEFSAPATRPDADLKNTVVISIGGLDSRSQDSWAGILDRSPCGTGTCAKMATLYAKGKLSLNQDFRHEGILGTVFTGRLLKETRVGPYPAVIPTISGQAWIYAMTQYVLDSDDPFPEGFTVGDIWRGASY